MKAKNFEEAKKEIYRLEDIIRKADELAENAPYIGCAANTLIGVSYNPPVDVMKELISKGEYCFIVFVDNNHIGGWNSISSGEKFAKLIKKEKLGEIWESDWRRNVFFGHDKDHEDRRVKVWTWHPDWKKMRAYVKKHDTEATGAPAKVKKAA